MTDFLRQFNKFVATMNDILVNKIHTYFSFVSTTTRNLGPCCTVSTRFNESVGTKPTIR